MKTLTISEYAYILHRYDGEITITDAEYNQLKNGEIDAKFFLLTVVRVYKWVLLAFIKVITYF